MTKRDEIESIEAYVHETHGISEHLRPTPQNRRLLLWASVGVVIWLAIGFHIMGKW